MRFGWQQGFLWQASVAFLLIVGCGNPTGATKDKSLPHDDKRDGLDRFDSLSRVSSAVSPQNWTQIQVIESAHPYADRSDNTWRIGASPQTVEMRIVFERMDLEDGYDFVYVSAQGRTTRHTGTQSNLEIVVPGDRVDVRLAADHSLTGWGFVARVYERRGCNCPAIAAPVCGSDNRTYANACEAGCVNVTVRYSGACADNPWQPLQLTLESPHPYGNGRNDEWQVGASGARRLRLHFARIDLERGYDFVRVLDRNQNVAFEYTGSANDVTTPEVEGDSLKVVLATDGSITGYGFRIDRAEVQGGCAVDADCGPNESCKAVACTRPPCFKACVPAGSTGDYQRVSLTSLRNNPRAFDRTAIEVVATPALASPVCTRLVCPSNDSCCNRCESTYTLDNAIVLADARERSFGCTGDTCDPARVCQPAFGTRSGEFTFRGIFRYGAFGAQTLLVDRHEANRCHRTGCNAELCANVDVTTPCENRPEYACYPPAECRAQADGFCAWTQTPALLACLANANNQGAEFSSTDTPLTIPDNTMNGISSRIVVAPSVGRGVWLSASIVHSYRGDLRVTIMGPSGQTRVLHDRTGGSFDDVLLERVDLADLVGLGRTDGVWTLRVEDLAQADTGTLSRWSLRVR